MYARVATFENPRFGDPSLVDELMSRAAEDSSRWRDALPGAQGGLMLVDQANNRGLGITFFETEEQIRDAEPVFDKMGDEIPEEERGRRMSVHVYEVADLEDGDGARAARASTLEGDPERIDGAQRESREQILPRARQFPGWKGFVALVDRRTGRTMMITLWDSEESMRASDEAGDKFRNQSAEAGQAMILSVDRYQVVFAERLAEVGAAR